MAKITELSRVGKFVSGFGGKETGLHQDIPDGERRAWYWGPRPSSRPAASPGCHVGDKGP